MKVGISVWASFSVLVVALLVTSCGGSDNAAAPAAAANCETHGVAVEKCGFCDKSLVESMGFCKEHDVAEVLCVTCSPAIIPAYKAEGDWCKEHATPESLCKLCGAE